MAARHHGHSVPALQALRSVVIHRSTFPDLWAGSSQPMMTGRVVAQLRAESKQFAGSMAGIYAYRALKDKPE